MRPTPAALFGIITLLGFCVAGYQAVFTPSTKAHFQLDVVLTPAELQDADKRDTAMKVLEWANEQKRNPGLMIFGFCNIVVGVVGLLAVRSNHRLQRLCLKSSGLK